MGGPKLSRVNGDTINLLCARGAHPLVNVENGGRVLAIRQANSSKPKEYVGTNPRRGGEEGRKATVQRKTRATILGLLRS